MKTKSETLINALLWIGGLSIVVAIVTKLPVLHQALITYLGSHPSSFLRLADSVLLLAIGLLLLRKKPEG